MLPIIRTEDNMKGYAFAMIDYSQEHYLIFACIMDNGEIWALDNRHIKGQENITLGRI